MIRPYTGHCLTALLTVGLLSGCANGQQSSTLGDLRYQPEPEPETEADQQVAASHSDVRNEYEALLTMVDDEEVQEQIQRRIGDVYMLEGEEAALEPDEAKSYYLDAIKSYREVLEKYPNSPDNAEVLYQLAKAYDMEGDQDEALAMLRELTERHPDYKHIAEANFRKADILFNLGAYEEAEAAYASIADFPESSFYLNAHYMLGWSRYKQLQYQDALEEFVFVLNQLLASGQQLDELSDPNRSLVNDTLHVVSLSLDKLGGAAAVQQIEGLQDQAYVWRVYDELGEYYLDKELFEASAESYRQFVKHYPDLERTPSLHRKLIDTYVEGSFPRQAFEEKAQFVAAYGINSDYAKQRGGVPETVVDDIQEYLHELARNYHARGQELQTEIKELNSHEDKRPRPEQLEELDQEAVAALDKAANYYQEYLDTFPDYEEREELVFYRAEALFAARRYEEAIPGYEQLAYKSETELGESYAADSAYAAVIAYERHLESLPEESQAAQDWRLAAVASMQEFSEAYFEDERAESVMDNAAEHLFDMQRYDEALQFAKRMLTKEDDLSTQLQQTAWGMTAYALFRLERYGEAAKDYLAQRELVPEGSDEYARITERLASATYRHAESLIEAGENREAISQLLRVKQLAPESPVRVTAQYDAATLLLDEQDWPAAITELEELSEQYPKHDLALEFPRKLAVAYEKNENWELAAETYKALSESDPDESLRQEALYVSARMFEKAERLEDAIYQFRDYAHNYPEPFSENMEARYRLAYNYQQIGDSQRRLFWLNKLVEGERDAGNNSNERSRWLAAWANAEYGDHYAEEFRHLNLYPPLGESLAAKNDALDRAADHYEQAADSGYFEFVTMSAHKIGNLYRRLGQELRDSPRPSGLSDEERQLYDEIIAEQALPFDELAMDYYQSNIERAWEGEYDQWIQESFARMRDLDPQRFDKTELIVSYGDEIR